MIVTATRGVKLMYWDWQAWRIAELLVESIVASFFSERGRWRTLAMPGWRPVRRPVCCLGQSLERALAGKLRKKIVQLLDCLGSWTYMSDWRGCWCGGSTREWRGEMGHWRRAHPWRFLETVDGRRNLWPVRNPHHHHLHRQQQQQQPQHRHLIYQLCYPNGELCALRQMMSLTKCGSIRHFAVQ